MENQEKTPEHRRVWPKIQKKKMACGQGASVGQEPVPTWASARAASRVGTVGLFLASPLTSPSVFFLSALCFLLLSVSHFLGGRCVLLSSNLCSALQLLFCLSVCLVCLLALLRPQGPSRTSGQLPGRGCGDSATDPLSTPTGSSCTWPSMQTTSTQRS